MNTHAPAKSDWTFCVDRLVEVSRTFSRPIAMLRDRLEIAVTCGYLLCRIADTVEDEPDLPTDVRDELYHAFLATIEKGADPRVFADAFAKAFEGQVEGNCERVLATNLDIVMRTLRSLRPQLVDIVLRWVAEMARGMNIYSRRVPGSDGWWALKTLTDLERYCYFVAGTVGHMLTELFLAELDDVTPEGVRGMNYYAEEFGLGLQLTNILKDITDDRERSVSFIPRTVCEAEGITVGDLVDSTKRHDAHRALVPVFDRAALALESAFAYCLSIPPQHVDVRLFCLLPLFMAVATLRHARNNDAQFETGEPVKITRAEVDTIIKQCVKLASDDDGLRKAYAVLSGASVTPIDAAASQRRAS